MWLHGMINDIFLLRKGSRRGGVLTVILLGRRSALACQFLTFYVYLCSHINNGGS